MKGIIMLNVIIINVVRCRYDALLGLMSLLLVIMLNVIMPDVVITNVVAPPTVPERLSIPAKTLRGRCSSRLSREHRRRLQNRFWNRFQNRFRWSEKRGGASARRG